MAESISFSAVNATEEIIFAATIDSEEIVFRYTDAARGPAGYGGGGGSVTSYVDDIESLPDYPTSFPTTPADINNVGTSKLLGRHGAGTGTAQEIGIDGGLELQGGNLRRAALTGFVEASAGSGTTTLSASAASEGGNGAADAGKLVKFGASGDIKADSVTAYSAASEGGCALFPTEIALFNGATSTLLSTLATDLRSVVFKDAAGTVAFMSDIPDISTKQDTLVSGTNIKTVNGNSLLGSGDVTISGATFDNPSAQVGLTAINGTASTAMRSDAAPAINQGITPSWTAAHTFTQSIAAGSTATAIELINPTAATSGNQRWSPATVWTGQGWKTNATAASQSVAFRAFTVPTQGSSAPSGEWTLQSSIAGAAFSTTLRIDTSGNIFGGGIRGSGACVYASSNNSSGGIELGANTVFGWSGGATSQSNTQSIDTILYRAAAANIRQGRGDAAAPVAQTSSVQNVVAGTSNTAGVNRTYAGSQGTGTGVGGDHIFTVATAGTSGTSQNALVEAFRVRQDRACFIANVSAEPATPTGGGVFYVEAGALKYKGSSGTVTTIANA